MAIDVDNNHPKKKHKQTRRLIECTTVINDEHHDHDVNPTDSRMCEMIEDL